MPNGEPVTKDEMEQLFAANNKEMERLFATKADLDQALTATKSDFKQLLTDTKAEFEQLFATKGDLDRALATTKGDFERLFATKADLASTEGRIEQLLADQANVILDAVDEKLDEKLDNKFGTVITKLDGVMKELQTHREEDVFGASQLRRHDDQLLDHARRINTLETSLASGS